MGTSLLSVGIESERFHAPVVHDQDIMGFSSGGENISNTFGLC